VQDITANSYGLSEYALYASFDDPMDEVFVIGDANITSTTGFFHNSINGAGQSALPCTEAETAMSDFPEADSFVTIGLFTGDDNATMLGFGFDEQSFIFGNNIGSNVGWVNADPFNDAGLAGADGLVLLGVFTPTNDASGAPGIVSGTITIGYAPDPESPTASFVTPAPGSLALLGLAAIGAPRRRRS
jgi:MYXO-CTERM domain-containing protein